MEKTLVAEHINKSFREPVLFQVLHDISLSVEQGEFVSIMGKSGCGKSTLLYILSTLDTDYEGQLHLDGRSLTGLSRNELAMVRNQDIGFVFQFHYLLPEFTVLENVMLPARKLGLRSESDIRLDAMEKLSLLHIADKADKRASRISGGEKQRVAIARALINNPRIIMGDEPTGNLDSQNSENVFSIFRQLSRSNNLSLLVVTHDEDFARRTDRVIWMEDGSLVSP